MKLREFKLLRPGDKVLIKKPKDKNEGPGWFDSMDYFDGEIHTIENLSGNDVLIEEKLGACRNLFFFYKWIIFIEPS